MARSPIDMPRRSRHDEDRFDTVAHRYIAKVYSVNGVRYVRHTPKGEQSWPPKGARVTKTRDIGNL